MTGRTSLAILGFKWGNGAAVQAPNKLVELVVVDAAKGAISATRDERRRKSAASVPVSCGRFEGQEEVWPMSLQMCLLQDAATDRKVAVNPQHVRIVTEDRPGLVEIIFDNECRVTI